MSSGLVFYCLAVWAWVLVQGLGPCGVGFTASGVGLGVAL